MVERVQVQGQNRAEDDENMYELLTRLLEVNDSAASGNGFSQQTRIVGGTSRNQCKTLHPLSYGWNIGKRLVKLNMWILFHKFRKFGTARTFGTWPQEPWFDDVA